MALMGNFHAELVPSYRTRVSSQMFGVLTSVVGSNAIGGVLWEKAGGGAAALASVLVVIPAAAGGSSSGPDFPRVSVGCRR